MGVETKQSSIEHSPLDWDQFVIWARENTNEGWAKIDAIMGSVADDERCVLYAVGHLDHSDQNIRDLAATILEATSFELTEETITSLEKMLDDEHFYAKFRAACALVKHQVNVERKEDIKAILQTALTDDDQEIIAIAQQYLEILEFKTLL